MLELHHHGSSACAAKVRLALAEKRLAWQGHYVDLLAGEQFSAAFLAINPKGVVPVLVHDGRVVRESTVICEYLEEVFPEFPLYPRTAHERATVRIWTKAVDEELHPACSTLTYVVSHRHAILANGAGTFEEFLQQGRGEGQAARERKWRWIQEGLAAPGVSDQVRIYDGYLQRMEEALRDSPWLVGDSLTMADVALAPYVNRLSALSMHEMWESGRYPRVADWFGRISARDTFAPALLDWVPESLRRDMQQHGARAWPEIRAWLR